jgi:hypothetical protein
VTSRLRNIYDSVALLCPDDRLALIRYMRKFCDGCGRVRRDPRAGCFGCEECQPSRYVRSVAPEEKR